MFRWKVTSRPCDRGTSGVRRPVAEHVVPGRGRQPEHPGRLAEPGRDLRLQLVLPDPDRAVELGGRLDIGGEAAGESLGIGSLDTDERLVPAQHLHGLAGVPQHGHHLSGDRVVGVGVHRQEHAVGAALGRGAQRLA